MFQQALTPLYLYAYSTYCSLQLQHTSLLINYKNFVLDQENNFYMINWSILITFFLDNVWILKGEVTC